MKKIFMMLGIASMITLISSCTTDPCEGKTCNSNGKPVSQTSSSSCICECNAGYTGDNCQNIILSNLVGKYKCVETGPTSTVEFEVEITGVSSDIVFFKNFSDAWSVSSVLGKINGTSISITGNDQRGQNPETNPSSPVYNYFVKTTENGLVKIVNGKPEIYMKYQVTTPNGSQINYSASFTKK
jgi:hypothetical protein